ncbi:MAG: hypothetical protein NXI20_23285 [bacterium]|nr:hypothetical protein [bacterium]
MTRAVILILGITIFLSGNSLGQYLDIDFPDKTPKLYAEGIINLNNRFQQNLTMTSDGKEHLITITDSALWRYQRILRIKNMDTEIAVDTPQFVKDFEYQNEWFIGEAMLSPDNKHLFFVADYPPDLWRSVRNEIGEWNKPTKLDDINTTKDDWYPTFSKYNNVYFTNGTIFRSGEEYNSRDTVLIPFSNPDLRDPCISPNEDYIIFAAIDSTNYGKSDLYVSFKDRNGNWGKAMNLGDKINTEFREFAPYISPDEKYLFFSRRDKWQNASFSNIYWVSMEAIFDLKD